MKKLALFSLMCCLGGVYAVPAFATCGASTLGFDGLQEPDDDEFLYESWDQFDSTRSGYENSNHQTSGDGKGIECDTINSAGCSNRETITLKPGHVFKGKVVPTQKTYKCTINLFQDDMWVEQAGEACEACETKWGDLCVGKSFANKTTVDCSGLNKTENNVDTVKTWQVICRPGRLVVCKPTKCKDGYKLDDKNGKCIKECETCGKKCKFDGKEYNYGDVISQAACPDLKGNDYADLRTGKNCKKYCLLDKNTNKDMGVWSIETCPSGMTGVALTNANKFDPKAPGYKKCVEKKAKPVAPVEQPVAPVEQPVAPVAEGDCYYELNAEIICDNGNYYIENTTQKLDMSKFAGFADCESVKEKLDRDVEFLKETFKDSCREKTAVSTLTITSTPVFTIDPYEVKQAQKTLDDFAMSAKDEASVWKTAEGKFNTTRLASDITAGVVLGTVGGVVTGNIIKKNQVKKGFEALHCTVGGQKVADWGDEFSVGLRR